MILKRIMNIMVNPCKKTTELIDKQQLTSLSTKEKIQLQVHQRMCKTCTAYEHQSKLIDKAIGRWFGFDKSKSTVKLSDNVKTQIISEIKKA
ncbi:hypothetical protein [Flavobacterium sp. K5-23]|uniref:hypothetical protein n=1 Tax=Flavobacterium sp. K5-23 TaxID=2746225 RepID=UPI00200C8F5F|nr:hypothetical protein [Flavobacterium sp. K5-23]UQD57354.1 hypothetical protein FLAK523_13505 [Flavobacterium sp. K5-23]